jgi:hypothetical protein
MRKFVLLGFLADQARILTEALPNDSLRFIESDRRNFQIPRCDLVIVWTRFVSHRLSAAAAARSSDQVLLHRGGIKQLVTILQNWNCKK